MSFLRYFFKDGRLFLYTAISALISLPMVVLLQAHRDIMLYCRLVLMTLLLLFLLRLADDYFDYEKDHDRKEQPLSKHQILLTAAVTMIIFVLLNFYFYQVSGLGSLCILIYLLLQQKAEMMKVFFMPLVSGYYFYVNQTPGMLTHVICGYLVVCVGLAVVFYWIKRRKSG